MEGEGQRLSMGQSTVETGGVATILAAPDLGGPFVCTPQLFGGHKHTGALALSAFRGNCGIQIGGVQLLFKGCTVLVGEGMVFGLHKRHP